MAFDKLFVAVLDRFGLKKVLFRSHDLVLVLPVWLISCTKSWQAFRLTQVNAVKIQTSDSLIYKKLLLHLYTFFLLLKEFFVAILGFLSGGFTNSNPGNATAIPDQKSHSAYLAVGGFLFLSYLSIIAALTNQVSLCMEEGG